MTHAQSASLSLLQPLDALLQPLRSRDSAVDAAPLTLVEDSLACAADFLLLHTLRAQLTAGSAGVATAHSATGGIDAADAGRGGPAVVLCHFKHSAAHYTHIARKWGVQLASHIGAGSLYMMHDLSAPLDAPAADPSAAPAAPAESFDEYLDRCFRTGTSSVDAAAAQPASPLQMWVASLLRLRARHSSLCLLVDDLQWLHAHCGEGERSVIDAIVTLQQRLAEADEADRAAATAAASGSADSGAGAAAAAVSSSLLVVSHGDVAASPAHTLLRRHASTFVRLSALQTGWSKDVSGVMSVQQQQRETGYWTPVQRAHYKLTDSAVKLAAPGHSTDTLEQ